MVIMIDLLDKPVQVGRWKAGTAVAGGHQLLAYLHMHTVQNISRLYLPRGYNILHRMLIKLTDLSPSSHLIFEKYTYVRFNLFSNFFKQ